MISTTGKSGGVVRILPYSSRHTGGLRSAWVYAPMSATPGLAMPVVYVLHAQREDAAEWASIDAATTILDDSAASRTFAPAVLVIPVAGPPKQSAARPSRKGGISDARCYATEVFSDLMPTIERTFTLSLERLQRTVVAIVDGGDGHVGGRLDDLFAAVRECNESLPVEERFRVILAGAPLARVLPGILRKTAAAGKPAREWAAGSVNRADRSGGATRGSGGPIEPGRKSGWP